MTMSTKTNRTNSGQATNRNVATATTFVRDNKGRFASTSSAKSTAKSTGNSTTVRVRATTAKPTKKTASSSFIQSMVVNPDNTVSVVMYRNPKTTYNYQPTKKGLASIQSAIKNNGSLGSVYNTQLKGREISRLIIK
jgi:hypothetical protein